MPGDQFICSKVICLVAGWKWAHVQGIKGSSLLRIQGLWLIMSLDTLSKVALAVFLIIQVFSVKDLPGAEVLGNAMFVGEVVWFLGGFHCQCFESFCWKCFVWKPVVCGSNAFLEESVVSFSLRNMTMCWRVVHGDPQFILNCIKHCNAMQLMDY